MSPLLGFCCAPFSKSILLRMLMCGSYRLMTVERDIMQREINWLTSCIQVQSKSYKIQAAKLYFLTRVQMMVFTLLLLMQSYICPGRSKINVVEVDILFCDIVFSIYFINQSKFKSKNSMAKIIAPLGPISYSSITSYTVIRSLIFMWLAGKL